MTIDRDSGIALPDNEARCNPAGVCSQSFHCARRLAPLPTQGTSMLSTDMPTPANGSCLHFLLASAYQRRRLHVAAPPPPPKTWPRNFLADSGDDQC